MPTTSATARKEQRAVMTLAKSKSLFKRKKKRVTLNRNILKSPKFHVNMKWSKNYLLTQQNGADNPTHQIFRWSSLFDPDFSSVSLADHQPWSYDTYSTLYKHYLVTSATVTIKAYANNNSVTALFLTNSAVNNPANLSSYTQFMENPATSGGMLTTQDGVKIFKKTYIKNKVYGNTQNANLTGLMGGTGVGSNPLEEYYLMVSLINVDPGEDANSVSFTVDINYKCELTENKTLATS